MDANHGNVGIFFREKLREDINSIVEGDVLYSNKLEIETILKKYDI